MKMEVTFSTKAQMQTVFKGTEVRNRPGVYTLVSNDLLRLVVISPDQAYIISKSYATGGNNTFSSDKIAPASEPYFRPHLEYVRSLEPVAITFSND